MTNRQIMAIGRCLDRVDTEISICKSNYEFLNQMSMDKAEKRRKFLDGQLERLTFIKDTLDSLLDD